MTDQAFHRDFDAAALERRKGKKKSKILATFDYGGEVFEVDLNVHAGKMLLWMRGGQKLEAVPEMLVMLLGEDRFLELCALDDPDWEELQDVISWLAELLGETGK
jgi:hypothetical protein